MIRILSLPVNKLSISILKINITIVEYDMFNKLLRPKWNAQAWFR